MVTGGGAVRVFVIENTMPARSNANSETATAIHTYLLRFKLTCKFITVVPNRQLRHYMRCPLFDTADNVRTSAIIEDYTHFRDEAYQPHPCINAAIIGHPAPQIMILLRILSEQFGVIVEVS